MRDEKEEELRVSPKAVVTSLRSGDRFSGFLTFKTAVIHFHPVGLSFSYFFGLMTYRYNLFIRKNLAHAGKCFRKGKISCAGMCLRTIELVNESWAQP